MSQVSVARWPKSWLPNQIAVWPIRWRNNELVSSITSKSSLLRKLYNCYKVFGYGLPHPVCRLSFWQLEMCSCVSERHLSIAYLQRRQAEEIHGSMKQVTSWWTSDPKLFLQMQIGKQAWRIAPRSQQNLATHVWQNLLLRNCCTCRATETWLMWPDCSSALRYSLAHETSCG